MTCVDFAAIVDAYVDLELAADGVAAADAHVANCAGCQRLVDDRLLLSRALSAIPYHEAPPRLRAAVVSRRQPGLSVPRRLLPLAAALVAAVALGVTGVGVRAIRQSRSDKAIAQVAESAVDAHVRVLQSGRLYDVVSSDQHTVKPWFLGKLNFAPPVEDLSSKGFPLAGGRLDALNGQPEAALIYMRRLHPIDVFVRPASPSDGRPDARTIRGFQVRHWTENEMSFWVVSDLAANELDEFVAALRQ